MKLGLYSSRPAFGSTFALTVNDEDGKGGVFDRIRVHNDREYVEIAVRGNVKIESQGTDQTVIRVFDYCADLILRQR